MDWQVTCRIKPSSQAAHADSSKPAGWEQEGVRRIGVWQADKHELVHVTIAAVRNTPMPSARTVSQ